jgi:H/ACA ribonucleoprotein complex subunit 1
LRDFFVSVKLSEEVKATSFKKGQQLFIDPAKMLPLARFLPGGDGESTVLLNTYEYVLSIFTIH